MMSAKPQPLASLPEEFSQVGKLMEQVMGFVPNSLLTLARRPALARSVMPMFAYLGGEDCLIERELRPLVSYIASYGAGCRYCQAHNSQVAALANVTQAKISDLWRFEESELFDERERAALAFAFAAGQQPSATDESHFERLAQHFSADEIIDLAGIVGIFGFLNRWNDMMMTELEDIPKQTAQALLGKSGWEAGRHAS